MCEFTVILESSKGRRVVAKNVIKAKTKEGKVVLLDSTGGVTRIEGAAILTVDTLMTELILVEGAVALSPGAAEPREQ